MVEIDNRDGLERAPFPTSQLSEYEMKGGREGVTASEKRPSLAAASLGLE